MAIKLMVITIKIQREYMYKVQQKKKISFNSCRLGLLISDPRPIDVKH
jgi:hypothetical protein